MAEPSLLAEAEAGGAEGATPQPGEPALLKNSFVKRRKIEPFYTGGPVAVSPCAPLFPPAAVLRFSPPLPLVAPPADQ